MSKQKVLYIIQSLQRAGAEKYLFELISNIDKSKYDVEVLTVKEVDTDTAWPHVYYHLLKDQGIKFHKYLFPSLLPMDGWSENIGIGRKLTFKLKFWINHALSALHKLRLSRLLTRYQWISVIDVLNYRGTIKSILDKKTNFDIHLMCHLSQFDFNIYKHLDLTRKYNFVFIDKLQITEAESKSIKIDRTEYFPLSVNLENYKSKLPNKPNGSTFRIGVFTRISPIKPVDKFLQAIREIKKRNDQVELHFFGIIQDKEYYGRLLALIKDLNIEGNVRFHGHSENMLNSVADNQINLVWMLSINAFVGYASIELALAEVPIVLFNLEKIAAGSNAENPTKYFSDVSKFAEYSFNLLQDENALRAYGSQLSSFYRAHHDISKNIASYETYLEKNLLQ